jgi:phospholipid/cholesterol/gamma-HCH transport system ATP-binding protein
MRNSDIPFVHQFIHAEMDGPVRFHYPAKDFSEVLELNSKGATNV